MTGAEKNDVAHGMKKEKGLYLLTGSQVAL